MGYIRVKSLVAVIGVGTKPGVRDHLAAQVSPAPMEEGL
jgi:pheromone shutdown protein TraB